MPTEYTEQQLQAFLDEGLPAEIMAEIEARMRIDPELLGRIRELIGRREAGIHSLGEIWRKHRLSCPTRRELGTFLLGALDEEQEAVIRCHIEQVGCRVCAANLDDLKAEQAQHFATTAPSISAKDQRRRRYFESSAGYLRRDR
ncbi:MAG: hypothetical protein U0892_11055 [Pirellulales bacterium]